LARLASLNAGRNLHFSSGMRKTATASGTMRTPLASRTASAMRAFGTRPRSLSTVGDQPAAAMLSLTARANVSACAAPALYRLDASRILDTKRTAAHTQAWLPMPGMPVDRAEVDRALRLGDSVRQGCRPMRLAPRLARNNCSRNWDTSPSERGCVLCVRLRRRDAVQA